MNPEASASRFQERVTEFIDRIVADRNRAVPACIDGLKSVILGSLLADLNGLIQDLSVTVGAPAATLVQRESRGLTQNGAAAQSNLVGWKTGTRQARQNRPGKLLILFASEQP